MLMGEVRAENLLRAMGPAVRAGLTAEQETAIRAAARQDTWQRHPFDIRLSLPTPFGRIYLALIAGRERRSTSRLAVERAPLARGGLAGLLVIAGIIVTTGLAGAAVKFDLRESTNC